jgi:hypothetical protein
MFVVEQSRGRLGKELVCVRATVGPTALLVAEVIGKFIGQTDLLWNLGLYTPLIQNEQMTHTGR